MSCIKEVVLLTAKIGRPRAKKPKTVQYSVRLDEETERRLIKYCEEHEITRMEAIRQGIHLLLSQK